MPIQNTGSDIRLRGNTGDSVTDINEEINGNATDTDVSLGTLNTSAFTNVSDGSVVTGRAMSEMQGYAAFESLFPSTEADGALGESIMTGGTNEYFRRTNSLSGNSKTFTLSFWIKINKVDTAYKTLLSAGDGGTDRAYFFFYNKKFHIYEYNGSSYTLQHEVDQIIDTSGWYHFVLAFDTTKDYAPDRTRVYINGIEVSLITTTSYDKNDESYIGRNNTFAIGYDYGLGSRFFPGIIADFKFIDGKQLRPNSFGELVQGIWIPKAFNTASTDTLVTNNLTLNYQLNGDATDSANSNDGTKSGGQFYANNYGIYNADGNVDRISVGSLTTIGTHLPFSITGWFYNDSSSNGLDAITAWYTTGTTSANFVLGRNSSGTWQYRLGHANSNELKVVMANEYELNKWVHVAFTYDGSKSTNGVKLYLNNVEASVKTIADNNLSTSTTFPNFAIGYGAWAGTYYDGKIGEVQLYSAALTEAQITQNYNAAKHKYTYGLNGFWLPLNNTSTGSIVDDSSLKLHLDASDSSSYGGSGTTWSDLTSNGNDATLVNGLNYISNNGGYFDADGSNDYIDLNYKIPCPVNFTLEFWFKYDSTSAGGRILGTVSRDDNCLAIECSATSGAVAIQCAGAGGSGANFGTNGPTDTNWHHWVITRDGSKIIYYLDGILKATSTGFSSTATYTSSYDSALMTLRNGYAHMNGSIAQFRYYDDTLTAQEVITNYRATQGNYEQVSTVDISGNANSFTPTNINAIDHIKDEPLDNYATLNPADLTTGGTISEGNLKFASGANGWNKVRTTLAATSGKWYFEMLHISATNNSQGIGIVDANAPNKGNELWGQTAGGINYYGQNGYLYENGGAAQTYSSTYGSNTRLMCAFDMDAGKIWFGRNGTWIGDPVAGTGAASTTIKNYITAATPFAASYYSGASMSFDFGQNGFTYTPPTGFKALTTSNLAAPAFDPDGSTPDKPSNYFKAVTYQGNGGTQGEAYGYKDGSRAAVFNGSSSKIDLGSSLIKQLPMTISLWLNPITNSNAAFYSNYSSSTEGFYCRVQSDGTFLIDAYNGGSNRTLLNNTTGSIPDNTWSHVAITFDSSNIILYINGSETDRVSTNANGIAFTASEPTKLGVRGTSSDWFNGKMDELRIFDKALSSTEVGYLADDDTANIDAISNLVAHYDMEGDANDSSGYADIDDHYFFVGDLGNQLTDVRLNTLDSEFSYTKPSGYDAWGGALDPSNTSGSQTFNFTESNKRWTKVSTSGYYNSVWSTIDHNTGKKYFEIEFLNKNIQFGISKLTTADNWTDNVKNNSIVYVDYATHSYEYSTTNLSQGQIITANSNGTSVIGIACDFDNQTLYYYYNNSLVDTATIASTNYNGTEGNVTYTQDKPYGNIDVGFAPDLVWVKNRTGTNSHALVDSVRGSNKYIFPDLTLAELSSSSTQDITSLDSNGFSLGTVQNAGSTNTNGGSIIAWAWKAGGAAVSDTTTGDIDASISANTNAGFSIIKYTGSGTSGHTVPHGLSSTPELTIIKNRDTGTNWDVSFDGITGGTSLNLDTTSAVFSPTLGYHVAGASTLTLNSGGSGVQRVNTLNDNYIAYCFHSVDGFSKIGSYTGNGSTDGPFVYTGFKPAWAIFKRTDVNGYNWYIWSNEVNKTNPLDAAFYADTSGSEYDFSAYPHQFLSNGIKIDTSNAAFNANGATYIYMAFAEDPVKYSNGVATLGDGNKFIQNANYPEDNFSATIYSGNGGTQKITTGVDADLVWAKRRNTATEDNVLFDTVRGVQNQIVSNKTNIESTKTNAIESFDVDGFTTGNNNALNTNGYNYVAWSWKAAGNANTYNILENGTITSDASASTLGLNTGSVTPTGISANKDNGFSIVKWTGTNNSNARTIAHGLSAPPEIIFIKALDLDSVWQIYAKPIGNDKKLVLGGVYGDDAASNSSRFGYTHPSSSLFTFKDTGMGTGGFIAYAWHSVPGFSKIGSYTGTTSSAINIKTGFEPAFVLIKGYAVGDSYGGSWLVVDNKRGDGGFSTAKFLRPDTNHQEFTNAVYGLNFKSDGFEIPSGTTSVNLNSNNAKFLYMAFAHR